MRATAIEIVRRLQQAGFAAYWAGGCVRDMLRGVSPEDYDVATSARPEAIERLFSHTIPVGKQFGVMLVIEGGHQFQVAAFRSESGYQDGRHPTSVQFTDAQTDASRRDFTVNGMFFDPVTEKLFDWVGGKADLQTRTLRTIGRPADRFAEDHLRLLRVIRFAAQLDFQIAPETWAAVRADAATIASVSAERVREELIRLLRAPHAARGLSLLRESGLLAQVLPEIAATVDCQQSPDFHPEGTVFEHLIKMLEQLPKEAALSLPWAMLLHDVAKPQTAETDPATGSIHFYGHERVGAEMSEQILERLRFPRKQIDEIVFAVRHHMQFKDVREMRKATLRRLLLRPTYPLELELHRLDCLGSHGRLDNYHYLQHARTELEQTPAAEPPLVRGRDLLELGLAPGPAMGQLLAEIRERQLEDELTTREQALAWVTAKLGEPRK